MGRPCEGATSLESEHKVGATLRDNLSEGEKRLGAKRRNFFAGSFLSLLSVYTSHCRVDGGISNNDFVLELMSSLTCQTIDRPSQTDMSTLGAAFLAGLAAGRFRYFIYRGFELSLHNTGGIASIRDRRSSHRKVAKQLHAP